MKETKEKIIRQALKYFIVNDYQSASLNSIAKSIGITKGGIYHYFESKDDLFNECILFFFETMNTIMSEMVNETVEEDVEKFVMSFFLLDELFDVIAERLEIDLLKDYLNYAYLIFQGMKKFPNLKEIVGEIYNNTRKMIQEQLESFQEKGLINKNLDCEICAIQILTQSEGLMLVTTVDKDIDFKGAGFGIVQNLLKMLK